MVKIMYLVHEMLIPKPLGEIERRTFKQVCCIFRCLALTLSFLKHKIKNSNEFDSIMNERKLGKKI